MGWGEPTACPGPTQRTRLALSRMEGSHPADRGRGPCPRPRAVPPHHTHCVTTFGRVSTFPTVGGAFGKDGSELPDRDTHKFLLSQGPLGHPQDHAAWRPVQC